MGPRIISRLLYIGGGSFLGSVQFVRADPQFGILLLGSFLFLIAACIFDHNNL